MFDMNPMLLIDGYKFSHSKMYPEGTEFVYSNWTPRSSRIEGQKEVVFFGLQYFLMEYMTRLMNERFFERPLDEVVNEYNNCISRYLGPDNNIGVQHIIDLHQLGYMPLRFRALPEGSLCPLKVPMLTVENTHSGFAWLTNYVETLMSAILWLPCTSATTSFRFRKLLDRHAQKTGGPAGFIPWQAHDFSMRGMAGMEASVLSAAGHLLNFTGSDSVPAIQFFDRYYKGALEPCIAGSVPAAEHSVMSAGGAENELRTFTHILEAYPTGIVSIVSDTWDLWNVILNILPQMKDKIMGRNGKLVIRPDSGSPADILCGNPNATGPAAKGVIELLWDVFGGTVNAAGYKELDPHIGAIYGDSITYERADEICSRLAAKGFASMNVVLGIGSYTYQYVTRDTYGFAMKATEARINGKWVNLFKKPITDDGSKFSATGRLVVVCGKSGQLSVEEKCSHNDERNSLLEVVWENGMFTKGFETLSGIRARMTSERAK